MTTQVARLGREVVGYLLGPCEDEVKNAKATKVNSNNGNSSFAALVALNNPNVSSPIGTLRGLVGFPSGKSWTTTTNQEGSSSLIMYADRQRPVIHLHTFSSSSTASTTCPLTARLHPPEPTPTLAISPDSTLLAAGSTSGRLYIWHLSSGHLLASFDAHFRAISCLQWTADGRALVSGSEDGRIMIWSKEGLLEERNGMDNVSSSSSSRPSPFAILADHVEGITGIALSSSSRSSISSFPSSLRIFSSSKDGTVKLWDVRTRSLVATWTFNGPVKHLVCDVGFRSFFVVVRGRGVVKNNKQKKVSEEEEMMEEEEEDEQEYDWVRRIDLFGGNAAETTSKGTGNTASLFRIEDAPQSLVYKANAGVRLTALAISMYGSHLLVGTSDTQLISIDVASSVVIRTTPLIAAGQTGTSTTSVLALSTNLIEDSSSLLQGSSIRTKGGYMGRSGDSSGWSIAESLGRTKPISSDQKFSMQLQNFDLNAILTEITPPSLRTANGQMGMQKAGGGAVDESTQEKLRIANAKIVELEKEKTKLNDLLKRAQKTNAGLWDRVVQDQLPASEK